MGKSISDALAAIHRSNFPFPDGLIFAFIGGSQLHGAKLEGNDDLDVYGVFIEPPEYPLGLDVHEHYVTSTSGNERRNGPDDVDITLYSLRKWAGLAAKGNPTALHFLFARQHLYETPTWIGLRHSAQRFLCRKQVAHFKGFADAQLKRLLGAKGNGKHGQRPELEERYGYDVKAGMHVIRLLNEGIELMRDHRITLPRPERELLIQIRQGAWSQDRLLNEANKLFAEIDTAADASTLPTHIDRRELSQIVATSYLQFWQEAKAQTQKGRKGNSRVTEVKTS